MAGLGGWMVVQGSGMICCFSLKNTSNPEYIFSTESGVSEAGCGSGGGGVGSGVWLVHEGMWSFGG